MVILACLTYYIKMSGLFASNSVLVYNKSSLYNEIAIISRDKMVICLFVPYFSTRKGYLVQIDLTFSFLKDNFYITVLSYHIGDRGDAENVHELESKSLKNREVRSVRQSHLWCR